MRPANGSSDSAPCLKGQPLGGYSGSWRLVLVRCHVDFRSQRGPHQPILRETRRFGPTSYRVFATSDAPSRTARPTADSARTTRRCGRAARAPPPPSAARGRPRTPPPPYTARPASRVPVDGGGARCLARRLSMQDPSSVGEPAHCNLHCGPIRGTAVVIALSTHRCRGRRPRRYGMTGSQSYGRRARARDRVAEAAYDSRVDTSRGVRAADERSRS